MSSCYCRLTFPLNPSHLLSNYENLNVFLFSHINEICDKGTGVHKIYRLDDLFFIYSHLCPHIIFILDTSEPCSILTSFTMQRHSWLIFCAAHRVWRSLGTWTFSLFGDDWHHLISSFYPGKHSSSRLDLFTYAIWNKIQI